MQRATCEEPRRGDSPVTANREEKARRSERAKIARMVEHFPIGRWAGDEFSVAYALREMIAAAIKEGKKK